VKVIDNGKGFDADARTAAVGGEAGIDLFDIRTRLRPFGGTLSIQSEPGTGTRAYIRVPTAPALEAMPVPRQARGRPA
jgi:signal transduction histidine kinase